MDIAANAAAEPAAQQHETPYVSPEAAPGPRLRENGLTNAERNWSIAIHLSSLAGLMVLGPFGVIAPLIIWLIRRNESTFNDDHGKEFLNFGMSLLVLTVGLALTIVGALLIPVLWIVGLVNMIRAAVAASNGEYFRYPMTIRFFT